MSCTIGRFVTRLPFLAALALLLAAEPAHAQRCMGRQQSGMSSLRTQAYASPYQNALQAQPYALQQYALQQYALQQYALQQYALQAQLNALSQNAYGAQLTGAPSEDALQAQINGLQQYTLLQQQNGQLTPSQLRALRKQQTALKKHLLALQTSGDY